MKVLHSISELGELEKGCVVTIGNFDGLHLGHQEILSTAKKLAAKKHTELLVITFDPHPAAVLHPDKAPQILTPGPLKQHLLTRCGVDCWLIINTERDVLSLSAPEFIEKLVVEPIAPAAIVEGEDFYFGANRSGNIELLQRLGPVNGFDVVVVPAKEVELDQTLRISSTMIRYMLTSGDVADAAAALGRPYKLIGPIVPGQGRGRKIGYPTLNMDRPEQIIPADGVYAGYVTIADTYGRACADEQRLVAVFSIGQARTFGDEHPLLIEAHLLSKADAQPGGKFIAMDFVEHIRRQYKFASADALAAQIAKDCKTANDILERRRLDGH
jgi:riboflavin kinase/FMN adenylyltransferase